MQLDLDELAGSGGLAVDVEEPSWEDVEDAIRRLDQTHHSQANITREGSGYMGINGGGTAYLVYIYTEDEVNLVPYDASRPEERVDLVAGGQLGAFNSRQVVGLEDAILAAKHYYETGQPCPSLVWRAE